MIKKLILILAFVALALVIVALVVSFVTRPKPPEQPVVREFPFRELSKEEIIVGIGSEVVAILNTFISNDPDFLSVDKAAFYLTESYHARLRRLAEQEFDPLAPAYEQEAEVLSSRVINIGNSFARVEYTINIKRLDRNTQSVERFIVDFQLVNGRWFISNVIPVQ